MSASYFCPIAITHSASGASASIHPFGATITSYTTSKGHEVLFCSELAKLDGSKAIRGGIPLVFPIFGPPAADNSDCKNMPQHGFLRGNYWKVGEPYDTEDEAGCEFTLDLEDVAKSRGDGAWAPSGTMDCHLSLKVTVVAETLTTVLTITNTGEEDITDYQTLFHTYFRVHGANAQSDPVSCNVSGLDGYSVVDKVTGDQYVFQAEDSQPLALGETEVDRVYTPPDGKDVVDVVICTGGNGEKVGLTASAVCGGVDLAVSAVVWNPYQEKAKGLGDFADEEYTDMICVEPGVLSGEGRVLKPGKEVVFTQVIKNL